MPGWRRDGRVPVYASHRAGRTGVAGGDTGSRATGRWRPGYRPGEDLRAATSLGEHHLPHAQSRGARNGFERVTQAGRVVGTARRMDRNAGPHPRPGATSGANHQARRKEPARLPIVPVQQRRVAHLVITLVPFQKALKFLVRVLLPTP